MLMAFLVDKYAKRTSIANLAGNTPKLRQKCSFEWTLVCRITFSTKRSRSGKAKIHTRYKVHGNKQCVFTIVSRRNLCH